MSPATSPAQLASSTDSADCVTVLTQQHVGLVHHVARQLAKRLHQHDLKQVLHNLPAGDWAKGERGIACDPTRISEFQDGVAKAIEYAQALGCTLAFNEASHVHVEFAKGVSVPISA